MYKTTYYEPLFFPPSLFYLLHLGSYITRASELGLLFGTTSTILPLFQYRNTFKITVLTQLSARGSSACLCLHPLSWSVICSVLKSWFVSNASSPAIWRNHLYSRDVKYLTSCHTELGNKCNWQGCPAQNPFTFCHGRKKEE